jgi:hypothetical protein
MSHKNISRQDLSARLHDLETTIEHCRVAMSLYAEQNADCADAEHIAEMGDFFLRTVLREVDEIHTETCATEPTFFEWLFGNRR